MAEEITGQEQGTHISVELGADGVNPVSNTNPPASGMWQKGQSGNMAGRPPGSRNMRTVIQELLDVDQKHLTEAQLKGAAKLFGKRVESLTVRELMIVAQVNQAINNGSTKAFVALAKLAGEMVEKVEGLDELMAGQVILLRPGIAKVNLDDFKDNPEAMEALLAEAAEEAKAKEQQ